MHKARRLIFMIRCSFQDLSKSAFNPLYGTLVCPHLEYCMPACSPNLAADINLSYEERLQWLCLHSLQRRRLRTDLITAFKIFKGLLDIDPNLFFLPPARRGLRGHPYKVCPPINSYHLHMSPNSLLYICRFFRPVVAYILPL